MKKKAFSTLVVAVTLLVVVSIFISSGRVTRGATFTSPVQGGTPTVVVVQPMPESEYTIPIVQGINTMSEPWPYGYRPGPVLGRVGWFFIFMDAPGYYPAWTTSEKNSVLQRASNERNAVLNQIPDTCYLVIDVIDYATVPWLHDPTQYFYPMLDAYAQDIPHTEQLASQNGYDKAATFFVTKRMPLHVCDIAGTPEIEMCPACGGAYPGAVSYINAGDMCLLDTIDDFPTFLHEGLHMCGNACEQYTGPDCNESCYTDTPQFYWEARPWWHTNFANGNSDIGQPNCPMNRPSVMKTIWHVPENYEPVVDPYLGHQLGWWLCGWSVNPRWMPRVTRAY